MIGAIIGKKMVGYGGSNSRVLQFGAIVEVDGKVFFDNTPIWTSRNNKEDFPYRIPISIISERRADASDVSPSLTFIRDKNKWGLYFIIGVRDISEEDYKTLVNKIERE